MAADINIKGANFKDGYGPIKVWRLAIVGLLCHLRSLPPPSSLPESPPEIPRNSVSRFIVGASHPPAVRRVGSCSGKQQDPDPPFDCFGRVFHRADA